MLPPAGFGPAGVARVVDDVVDRAGAVEADRQTSCSRTPGRSGTSKPCEAWSVGSTLVKM